MERVARKKREARTAGGGKKEIKFIREEERKRAKGKESEKTSEICKDKNTIDGSESE